LSFFFPLAFFGMVADFVCPFSLTLESYRQFSWLVIGGNMSETKETKKMASLKSDELDASGSSEYEQLRLANMKRNNSVMSELGLHVKNPFAKPKRAKVVVK
jgi:hypothetical protein